jgi:hypothetical protein
MNPMPPIAKAPLWATGYEQPAVLLPAFLILLLFAVLLWSAGRPLRERARLRCPARLRAARVSFAVAPDGKRLDVVHCSVFGRRPITCGKVCLHVAQP